MSEHLEYRTVSNALASDCFYGECEHLDKQGEPSDYSACPTISLKVCVDCMVERGQGSDPQRWEDELVAWPHKSPVAQITESQPAPTLLKPPPERVSCEHGYDHYDGPHACDSCVANSCPHWVWLQDHEAAAAKLEQSRTVVKS